MRLQHEVAACHADTEVARTAADSRPGAAAVARSAVSSVNRGWVWPPLAMPHVSADPSRTNHLADWSPWAEMPAALASAPLTPGVYMARDGATGPVVYVGMAGERRGKGIRGRLAVYGSGKGMVSGLGEAAMDRALTDPDWIRKRLEELLAGEPRRAKEWARLALERAGLQVRWAVTADRPAARILELAVLAELRDAALWNRAR